MLEGLNRLMYFGVGAVEMSRKKAEEIFDECVRRGQVEDTKRDVFVKDLMDASEKARTRLEEIISRQVEETVKKLPLATRDDLARIEAKIDELLARRPGGVE